MGIAQQGIRFFCEILEFTGLPYTKLRKKNALYLALFHRVNVLGSALWQPLKPDDFRSIIKNLASRFNLVDFNYESVNLASSKPNLIISFDDGFKDFYTTAYPILMDFGISKVNHNVVVDSVMTGIPPWTSILHAYIERQVMDRKEIIIEGQGNFTDLIQPTVGIEAAQIYNAIYAYLQVAPFHVTHRFIHDVLRPEIPVLELPEMMHIDELIELKTAGVQIGNHSWNHYMLHHGVPEGILNKEIIESKSWLEEQLNIEVNCFAFPNGLFDAESLGKVEESGYSQILFTHQGAQNKVNHFNRTDFYHPIYSKNLIRMAYNR